MSDRGYVKISRKAYAARDEGGDPFWNERREFSRWEAWEWMIQEANWETRERPVRTRRVELARGEFLGSVRYLAQAWGWTEKRVRVFLRTVLDMDRIRISRETVDGTVYALTNYERYQGTGESSEDAENPARGAQAAEASGAQDIPEWARVSGVQGHTNGSTNGARGTAKGTAEGTAKGTGEGTGLSSNGAENPGPGAQAGAQVGAQEGAQRRAQNRSSKAGKKTDPSPNGDGPFEAGGSWMWEAWREECAKEVPGLSYTDKRREKFAALFREQLQASSDPRGDLRAILRAVKAHPWWGARPSTWKPETCFRNAERREEFAAAARGLAPADRAEGGEGKVYAVAGGGNRGWWEDEEIR